MTNLRIANWNINGLRARLPRVLAFLQRHQPQVVLLQETKIPDELFPLESFAALGYQAVFYGQKGFNGVAILSRLPLDNVQKGFGHAPEDEQKRLLAATVAGIRLVNVYIPNGEAPNSPKFLYKLNFFERLQTYLQAHSPRDKLLLAGDFNVAPQSEDVYSAADMEGHIGFHPVERQALAQLKTWGWVDQFRAFESRGGVFSWWDYRAGSFERNKGLRIDHIWTSPPLAAHATRCWIDKDERAGEKPSDHAPVLAEFAIME